MPSGISPGGRPIDESPLSQSKTSNYIARHGGLPPYIRGVARGIAKRRHGGKVTGSDIAAAKNKMELWARTSKNPAVKAAAIAALAQWHALFGATKGHTVKDLSARAVEYVDLAMAPCPPGSKPMPPGNKLTVALLARKRAAAKKPKQKDFSNPAKRVEHVDLSSHVPGTPYRYKHGWIPLEHGDGGKIGRHTVERSAGGYTVKTDGRHVSEHGTKTDARAKAEYLHNRDTDLQDRIAKARAKNFHDYPSDYRTESPTGERKVLIGDGNNGTVLIHHSNRPNSEADKKANPRPTLESIGKDQQKHETARLTTALGKRNESTPTSGAQKLPADSRFGVEKGGTGWHSVTKGARPEDSSRSNGYFKTKKAATADALARHNRAAALTNGNRDNTNRAAAERQMREKAQKAVQKARIPSSPASEKPLTRGQKIRRDATLPMLAGSLLGRPAQLPSGSRNKLGGNTPAVEKALKENLADYKAGKISKDEYLRRRGEIRNRSN